jgi:hypothetical protein
MLGSGGACKLHSNMSGHLKLSTRCLRMEALQGRLVTGPYRQSMVKVSLFNVSSNGNTMHKGGSCKVVAVQLHGRQLLPGGRMQSLPFQSSVLLQAPL